MVTIIGGHTESFGKNHDHRGAKRFRLMLNDLVYSVSILLNNDLICYPS
jgi:hypothetical protein